MDRVPYLTGTAGLLKGRRNVIDAEGLVLGRDPGCSVQIDDPGVSREHARVFLHNGSVWVQDAGSRNGVFVNDKRVVRPKTVSPGDDIRVGDHSFTIELAEAGELPSGPTPPPRSKPAPYQGPDSPTLDAPRQVAEASAPKGLWLGGAIVLLLAGIGLAYALLT